MAEREMFYGASADIFQKARELRENMTESEQLLWNELKQNQLLGLRFKSQHPISHFIADFYCHKLKLVIEIDGGYHSQKDQKEYDDARDFEMRELGLFVLRFNARDVSERTDHVMRRIDIKCKELLSGSTL